MKLLYRPKKSLGQNFLVDKNIINKIVKIADINESKTVMEIGSGYGSLTEVIALSNPKKIIAIEKDKNLAIHLKNKFENFQNIEIINQDILNLMEKKILDKNIVVFGNLPYNISTKILASLILIQNWPPWYDKLILMFQKEVAERILARVKSKEFGRLSVLTNWRLEVKKHFNVSNNSFFPKPKVYSTILSFTPKKNNLFNLSNPSNLEKVTRILFSNRRKMLNKNIRKLFNQNKTAIKNLNIDLNKRPGDLNCETYYKIAKLYEKLSR